MANYSPYLRIAIPAAALLLLALAALLLWPQNVDPPLDPAIDLPAPPLAEAPRWPRAEDAPELQWRLAGDATLTLPGGSAFSPTPAPTPQHWEFQQLLISDWTALSARADNGDQATWWMAENAPFAILDLQADLSRGDWSIELPDLPLRAYPADLLASTDAIEDLADAPLSALTLQGEQAPLSITVDGPVRATLDTSASPPRLRLNALPHDCESLISAPTSLRLTLHYGEAPLPRAALAPPGATSQLIAIFAEPVDRGGDPWEEGRSRDADELARRIRALIFGHSNPDDPRYGNGGLLQQNLGASFIIPSNWWETPAIAALREDLEQTPYELILATDTPGTSPPNLTLRSDAPLECDTLNAHPFIIGRPDANAPRYSLGQWLPQTPQVSPVAPTRDALLQHLLPPQGAAGGLRPGRLTISLLPLIASRNPLVESFQNTLLVPERRGHWTLHEDLSRALVAFEFRPDRAQLAITALAHRAAAQHLPTPPAIWLSEQSLSDTADLLLTPEGPVSAQTPGLSSPPPLQWTIAP
ncbi:hypothetical protein FRC98_03720 [Lujinxingia vulgaris]|uniref:Uncharacterized protein n=1 Tax=Lujinxingia vulgaris TaxID=2600176 RepID=A0A5C6XDY4_9DELT|nr:hypothetical protein [Lujinxingia vulgaris]TXD38019.1 hypothetical protein FRC98_03720 [Lujinxingia vulgaris]